jgi:protein SCO1
MQRKTLIVGVGIAVVLLVFSLFYFLTNKPSLRGAIIDPPWAAPEISLQNQNGKPFSLTDQRGKVVLLYFGYVNCPDECPLTMAHVKLARESLGDRAQDVQVIMVSTDPVRDTPQALKTFMEHFDPSFLGLTGPVPDLQKTWQDYGVTVEDGGKTHSTYLYVIDPAGNIRETFLPDTEPQEIAADLKLLLKEK